jgi:hypothetical protein
MVISELQLAILAVGIAAVIGVFAYNKWQERRFREQSERGFAGEHADVLLEGTPAPPAGGGGERIEPVDASLSAAPEAPDEAVAPAPEPEMPLVHPAADCVARFEAAEPIAAPQLWQAVQETMAGIDRPVRWLGWNENRKTWQLLQAHTAIACRQWRAVLQLADRRGAVSEAGIEGFRRALQQLGDRFMAVDLPQREQLRQRAAEIDRFCAGVDVQIAIHVVANDAAGFPGTKLRGIAEAAGMALEEDGMFHARDDAGHQLFTMGNLEPALFTAEGMAELTSHGLTLSLDVPCVTSGGAAFGSMVTAARQLAAGLNGSVVDDNRAALTQKALDVIRAKIVEFQDVMSKRGIAAGSATALRLFA